jgi:LPXTG-motif cell wall-anchored protein
VSTETTNTTTPVSTVPTTPVTVRPGEPVFIERQVENAVATPYAVTTSELPRTGGPDGGPFIVAGLGLMAAGGGLWLLQRRRTST